MSTFVQIACTECAARALRSQWKHEKPTSAMQQTGAVETWESVCHSQLPLDTSSFWPLEWTAFDNVEASRVIIKRFKTPKSTLKRSFGASRFLCSGWTALSRSRSHWKQPRDAKLMHSGASPTPLVIAFSSPLNAAVTLASQR